MKRWITILMVLLLAVSPAMPTVAESFGDAPMVPEETTAPQNLPTEALEPDIFASAPKVGLVAEEITEEPVSDKAEPPVLEEAMPEAPTHTTEALLTAEEEQPDSTASPDASSTPDPDDTAIDASIMEADGVELSPEDMALLDGELVERAAPTEMQLGKTYSGNTSTERRFRFYSDFPLTIKLNTQIAWPGANLKIVEEDTGTVLYFTGYNQIEAGGYSHTFTMERHSALTITVAKYIAVGNQTAAYSFTFTALRSAAVWLYRPDIDEAGLHTPLKVSGEVRGPGVVSGYAFDLQKDQDPTGPDFVWANVPGTRAFASVPEHTYYPGEAGYYRVAMHYYHHDPVTNITAWYTVYTDVYEIGPATIAEAAVLIPDANHIWYRNTDLTLQLTFSGVPTFSLIRIYNDRFQMVHEQVTASNAYYRVGSSYSCRLVWNPPQNGLYHMIGLAYDGMNWSYRVSPWFSIVDPIRSYLKKLTLADDTIELGESACFFIESNGATPQGSCLRITRGGVEKASFYGLHQFNEYYVYQPMETGVYQYIYLQKIDGGWEHLASGWFRVSNVSSSVAQLNIRKRYNLYGHFDRIDVGFSASSPADQIPSFVGFYLKEAGDHRIIRSKVTTQFWWSFYRIPPGTYYCTANYHVNGVWKTVTSGQITISPTEWTEATPPEL